MDFFNCLSLVEAINVVRNKTADLAVGTEYVDLSEALGRIVAEDIAAKADLPPFARSTVDGFAVRSSDTFGAGEGIPALLNVTGEILMGQGTPIRLKPGQAAVIPTGGMLPEAADAVVMVEYTDGPDAETVLILKAVAPGENTIAKGEDLLAGEIIVQRGRKILPQDIGALAAAGHMKIAVRHKPRIGIISTGDELVDVTAVPKAGQITDINSYALGAMLELAGCNVTRLGIIPDQYELLYNTLMQALNCYDLLIVSGGSSVGARDHTLQAINALGQPGVILHGVAVKPGKPTIFGMAGSVPIFGLPGHPVSAMIICEQLVKPVIAALVGQQPGKHSYRLPARITRSVASAPGRDDFLRVRLSYQDGQYLAEPVLGKAGLISTMIQADGVVHIPADKTGLYDGDFVEVTLFNV